MGEVDGLVKSQQLSEFPFCAMPLCWFWHWWYFDIKVSSMSRPHTCDCYGCHPCCQIVAVLFIYLCFILLSKLEFTAWEKCVRAEKTALPWSWQGQIWAKCTSMQTFSSSICSVNRKISSKVIEVITLDKKKICCCSAVQWYRHLKLFLGAFGRWGEIEFLSREMVWGFCCLHICYLPGFEAPFVELHHIKKIHS